MTKKIIRHRGSQDLLTPFFGETENFWDDWGFPQFSLGFPSSGFLRFPDFSGARNFSPAVDISEDESGFFVEADLPGFEIDKVSVEVQDDSLTISANIENKNEEKKKNYLRSERIKSSFSKTLNFPPTADLSKVECTAKNGVLEVFVPKKKEGKGKKKIDIKILD